MDAVTFPTLAIVFVFLLLCRASFAALISRQDACAIVVVIAVSVDVVGCVFLSDAFHFHLITLESAVLGETWQCRFSKRLSYYVQIRNTFIFHLGRRVMKRREMDEEKKNHQTFEKSN